MAVSLTRRKDIWLWHCTSRVTAVYLTVNIKLEADWQNIAGRGWWWCCLYCTMLATVCHSLYTTQVVFFDVAALLWFCSRNIGILCIIYIHIYNIVSRLNKYINFEVTASEILRYLRKLSTKRSDIWFSRGLSFLNVFKFKILLNPFNTNTVEPQTSNTIRFRRRFDFQDVRISS
jgi:hypothetical protein